MSTVWPSRSRKSFRYQIVPSTAPHPVGGIGIVPWPTSASLMGGGCYHRSPLRCQQESQASPARGHDASGVGLAVTEPAPRRDDDVLARPSAEPGRPPRESAVGDD